MKREEKNLQSRQKIIAAAIQEFGKKSYTEASLNTICSSGDISKGIIYHYFKDKDELYLVCVKECFDEFTAFLDQVYDFTDFQKGINQYLAARYQFFREFPDYCHIFCNAVFQPPAHLLTEIKEQRKAFDAQSTKHYKNVLSRIILRKGLTEEDAMEYFVFFHEMFNSYYISKAFDHTAYNTFIEEREKKLSKLLNMMLYGITKEDPEL